MKHNYGPTSVEDFSYSESLVYNKGLIMGADDW